MDANSLISLFGQETGTPLAFSEAGTLALAFEAGPTVQLEHDSLIDAIHCYVVLGQAPADPDARQDVFRRMLAANVFGHDTDGATLGLDEVTGELILSRRLELSYADTARLRAMLESMVPLALDWQQRLAGAPVDDAMDISAAEMGNLPDPGFGLRV
ncbi:type III secretion system chaperone [Alcaligenes sp. Marseille-Q7550]